MNKRKRRSREFDINHMAISAMLARYAISALAKALNYLVRCVFGNVFSSECWAWLLATFPTLWHRWKLIVIGPESDYEQQYVSCCLECMPNQKNLLAVIIDNHFGCLCLRRTTMPVTLLLAASFNWWRGPTQFLSLTEEKENNMRLDLSLTQYQFWSNRLWTYSC